MKLTKKEQNESVFMTLGRLEGAITNLEGAITNPKYYLGSMEKAGRARALLKKISKDVSAMDLAIPSRERVTF